MTSLGPTGLRHADEGGTQKRSLPLVSDANAAEDTRAFWSSRTGLAVTPDEAREIDRNIARFFDLLAKWDEAARQTEGVPQ